MVVTQHPITFEKLILWNLFSAFFTPHFTLPDIRSKRIQAKTSIYACIKERRTDRERDRETERQRVTERDREVQRDTERHRKTQRQIDTDTERQRGIDRHRET
jgi:RNA-binding protein 25